MPNHTRIDVGALSEWADESTPATTPAIIRQEAILVSNKNVAPIPIAMSDVSPIEPAI